MNDFMAEMLRNSFMQYALLACLLASIGCGVIGTYVVVKRIGFLAGGIAHSVLAGMGIAIFLHASPLAGAVIAALVSGVLIGWINLHLRQHEDILIATFWSMGMAIGILFISRIPGYNIDLMSYLFGNILLVSERDLYLMLILDMVIIALVFLFYRQFLATSFDEEFARLRGLNVEFFYILLLCTVALTVVLLIQVVGLILVLALLILPAATAAQLAGSILRIMISAVVLSVVITVAGLLISYAPDLPSGSTIIVLAGSVYIVTLFAQILYRKFRDV
jgi:zinc transport system permease protein